MKTILEKIITPDVLWGAYCISVYIIVAVIIFFYVTSDERKREQERFDACRAKCAPYLLWSYDDKIDRCICDMGRLLKQ